MENTDKIQNVKTALESCDPERRWKTEKLIKGAFVVGNGHFFVALTHGEFLQLGVELINLSDDKVKRLEKQIAFDKLNGAQVSQVGEIDCGIDGESVVLEFQMGWRFPIKKRFSALVGSGRMTATSFGNGFLVISRGEDGHVILGAMSIGEQSQGRIEEDMKPATVAA